MMIKITLKADIFIQPNAPANLILFVDRKLLSQQIVSLPVDFLVMGFIWTCVDWTKFTIPDLRGMFLARERITTIAAILTGTLCFLMNSTLRSYCLRSKSFCSEVPVYGVPIGKPIVE